MPASPEPYRSQLPVAPNDAPRELVYNSGTGGMLWKGALVTAICFTVGAVVGALRDRPGTGILVGIGVSVLLTLGLRKIGDAAGVVLRVDGSVLTLRRGKAGAVLFRGPLEDLLDVKIDTETITNVVLVSSSPGYGMPQSGGGSSDESRIALFLRNSEQPLYLSDRRASNILTTDWLGTIRRFLRAQGWLPIEERGDVVNE